MVEIKKGHEPQKLLEYRLSKTATYADMPTDVKEKVKDALIQDQHGLCAYCMCKITLGTGDYRSTIEHLNPQADTDERERLNYRNMVAVCWGNRDADSPEKKSCDARRGSLPRHPVNQQTMNRINVLDGRTLTSIHYKADGTIFSDDPGVDEDLNLRLNLNCTARQLKDCRLRVLHQFFLEIQKRYSGKSVSKEHFQKLLSTYTSDNIPQHTPFCGIIIDWLHKKV